MPANAFRTFARLAAVCCVSLFVGVPTPAHSQKAENGPVVRPGTYPGQWHKISVSITVEKVGKSGLFKGKVKVLEGEDQGYEFPFRGILLEDHSVVLTRIDDAPQASEAGPPRLRGDEYVWTGRTLDFARGDMGAFVMRLPKK